MTETLANGYSSKVFRENYSMSNKLTGFREFSKIVASLGLTIQNDKRKKSNEYQHDRI